MIKQVQTRQYTNKQPQQLAQIISPILPLRFDSESILSRDLIVAIRSIDQPDNSLLYQRAEAMDLGGWNFDPSMLSSLAWSDNNIEGASDHGEKGQKKGKTGSKATSSTRSSPARLDSTNWVGNLSLLSNFGELDYDGRGGCSQQSKSSDNDGDGGNTSQSLPALDSCLTTQNQSKMSRESMRETHTVSEAQSVNSGIKDGGTSSVATGTSSATSNLASGMGAPQLHPMAIQSSATCPPHSSAANNGPSLTNTQTNSYLQMRTGDMGGGQNHQAPSDIFGLQGIDSAALASLTAAFQSHSDNTHNNHISTLAANFMLATQAKQTDNHALSDSHQPQHRPVSSTLPPQAHSGSVASAPQLGRQHRQQPKNTASSKPPPFYLFDAPIELRANFMQNQRKLGLPIQHDPNSYHYGETVKGFHPQSLMNQQQLNSLSAPNQVNQVLDAPVQLIDARHGNIRASFSGRVKNEREQKRAQKITELIEQLRLDMEKGGCKVEMRSKFHTLSQCADYVKVLIKSTKEKEDAIDKLKSDLEVKKRKIEEEKAAQESRSDPESVTSSLTSDTNSSLRHSRSQQPPSKKMKGTTNDKGADNQQQDNTTSYHNMSSVSTNEDSSGGGDGSGDGSGNGSGEPSARGRSTDKTENTGVSDLTDSNRASSSNNSGSGANSGKTESVSRDQLDENGEQFQPSSSSISSDAAVASERSSRDRHTEEHHHNHKDVVFNQHGKRQHRKRPPEEVTSLEPQFGLDYEEVFTMSNVPQLIATTSGKIVTWNKCFLKLTGIRRSELERMTIFSLVKPEMLSNFFEIVAHALKPSTSSDARTETGATEMASEPKSTNEEASSTSTRTNYAAMTLPCVNFPAMRKRREVDHSHPTPQLHVTVTLMSDDDPRKRCFHCVFSNCTGTNGTLGILTPDLLASLFATPEPSHKKHKRHRERGETKYTRNRHHDKDLRDETKIDQDMTFEDKEKNEIKAEGGKGDSIEMEALTDQLDVFNGEKE